MAKIAVELGRALAQRKRHGTRGGTSSRLIAEGPGWTVADVICTSGPHDPMFEERHAHSAIAIVLAGSFQYTTGRGRMLMTPGSLLLGNRDQCYECGHAHGEGDRCVSFWYAPDFLERLAADAGARSGRMRFAAPRLPAIREMSPLVARAALGVSGAADVGWEELAIDLAVRAIGLVNDNRGETSAPPSAEARVSRAVRAIDGHPEGELTVTRLARNAGLSPFHFLRTFERLTGVTPHQYVLRARLRGAAVRLVEEPGNVLEIALDSGFGDVSNFNRAFRAEFQVSPTAFRERHTKTAS